MKLWAPSKSNVIVESGEDYWMDIRTDNNLQIYFQSEREDLNDRVYSP